MKTIGLLGGMSWESTVTYYRIINETVKEKLGGLHSAKIVMYSVDFAEIEACQANGDWEKSGRILSDAAAALEKAGANFIVICTNTMHKTAPAIQARISVPILHIADATAEALIRNGIKRVGLLGTKYTLTQDFYKDRIAAKGLDVLVPEPAQIERVNAVIYDELCLGIVSEKSKKEYLRIIADLKSRGAEAVILGCTEIGLLISQEDSDIPVFDTAKIHAQLAAQKAVESTYPDAEHRGMLFS